MNSTIVPICNTKIPMIHCFVCEILLFGFETSPVDERRAAKCIRHLRYSALHPTRQRFV